MPISDEELPPGAITSFEVGDSYMDRDANEFDSPGETGRSSSCSSSRFSVKDDTRASIDAWVSLRFGLWSFVGLWCFAESG